MQNVSKKALVAIVQSESSYPNSFNPAKLYPEFKSSNLHKNVDPTNHVFQSLRELFILLKMDEKNLTKESWNPLSEIISEGNVVLIKPNLVKHKSKRKDTKLEELVSHPSIIAVIIDYVILALNGKGTIIIGDAPIQEADFDELMVYLKLKDFINERKKLTSINFEIIDFRKEMAINKIYREIQRKVLPGDPRGYSVVDLGMKSALIDITKQFENFRVTNYDRNKMLEFHSENHHSYIIANSVLKSDVIISIPKLKTHRKAGLTCALKNSIGINGSKDCLPHHRKGSTEENGDEYLKKSFRKKLLSNIEERRAKSKSGLFCFFLFLTKLILYFFEKIFPYKDPYKEGSWYGNETIPRTIVDINYILNFASKDGKLVDLKKKRKLLAITDAIVSGEEDGPLCPTRKETGYLIASQDFIANDIITSYLARFDPNKIPTIRLSLNSPINNNKIKSPKDIQLISNNENFSSIGKLINFNEICFEPTKGWKNHIELKE